jgi:hypothetical protein
MPSIDLHQSKMRDYKLFSDIDQRHISKLPESTQYETKITPNAINLVTPRKSTVHCKTKVFHTHTIWHITLINQQSRQQSRQLAVILTYNHGLFFHCWGLNRSQQTDEKLPRDLHSVDDYNRKCHKDGLPYVPGNYRYTK